MELENRITKGTTLSSQKSVYSDTVKLAKGQIISKENCQAVNSFKKRTNEFVFDTMRRIFGCFLEEIVDTKEIFRNYLTFR